MVYVRDSNSDWALYDIVRDYQGSITARLYDPALGRFLSPDPYVQAPDFSQNALFGINWYDSGARFQTTDGWTAVALHNATTSPTIWVLRGWS